MSATEQAWVEYDERPRCHRCGTATALIRGHCVRCAKALADDGYFCYPHGAHMGFCSACALMEERAGELRTALHGRPVDTRGPWERGAYGEGTAKEAL